MVEVNILNLEFRIQPQVLTRLSNLDEASDMNYAQLEQIIQSDQNLVAMLLKMSNSSFYSRGNTIKSLKTALSILGFKLIKTFAMTFSTQMLFSGSAYTRFNKYVWKHSIVTAILCKWLNDQKKITDPDSVFIAGILHDIGKVVLSETNRKAFIEVINNATAREATFHSVEKTLFNIDHNEAGHNITQSWKLSESIVLACKYHELDCEIPADLTPSYTGLLKILRLSNYLAHKMGYGHLAANEDSMCDKAFTDVGLKSSNSSTVIEEAKEYLETDEFAVYFLKNMG